MGVCMVVQSELSDAAKSAGGSAAEPVKHALLPLPACHVNRDTSTLLCTSTGTWMRARGGGHAEGAAATAVAGGGTAVKPFMHHCFLLAT